jgi:hypothetical protein
VVSAVGAAASAAAAWRSSALTLRLVRERDSNANGEIDVRELSQRRGLRQRLRDLFRRFRLALANLWRPGPTRSGGRPVLKALGYWYDPSGIGAIDLTLGQVDQMSRGLDTETGNHQLVRLINSSSYPAVDVHVAVYIDGEIVGAENVDRIDPMPVHSAAITPWEGCRFLSPWDASWKREIVVAFSDASRRHRYEMRWNPYSQAGGIRRISVPAQGPQASPQQ